MATKKTKTTAVTVIDGTTTTIPVTDVVAKAAETISNEGSSGALTVAHDLTAGATSSQDPAKATGEEQLGGTNTQGDDADANGKAPAVRQIPEPALTVNEAAANPEAEASAPGTLSSNEAYLMGGILSPEGVEYDGVFLSRREVADICAAAMREAVAARKALPERRTFELLKGVLLHNKIVDSGNVSVTQDEHAALAAQEVVLSDWDADAIEVDA